MEKRVTFNDKVQIKIMRVHLFAAHRARCYNYRSAAADIERFENRIYNTGEKLKNVLQEKIIVMNFKMSVQRLINDSNKLFEKMLRDKFIEIANRKKFQCCLDQIKSILA